MQRKPAAPVELELRLLKAKKQACRLQHFARRLISAQVTGNMLTDRSLNRNMTAMIRQFTLKSFAAGVLSLCIPVSDASAGDQAKAIVNALDPKSMSELFEVARRKPDAALTNIAPVSANTFRFLFIWPASNPAMTFDRVGRSFAERFAYFAEQWKLLAAGFCLSGPNLMFGTAPYGEEEVNVAYRDIEVRYAMGKQAPCEGRYVSIADVERTLRPSAAWNGYSIGALPSPSQQMTKPEEGLKPFLNPGPAAPPQ